MGSENEQEPDGYDLAEKEGFDRWLKSQYEILVKDERDKHLAREAFNAGFDAAYNIQRGN